jgi:hypothetical protein
MAMKLHDTIKASDAPQIGNFVKSFKATDRRPAFGAVGFSHHWLGSGQELGVDAPQLHDFIGNSAKAWMNA